MDKITYQLQVTFKLYFSGVRVTRSLVLCVILCRSLLVHLSFCLAIVLSVLRYTDFYYLFGIFKIFLELFCY